MSALARRTTFSTSRLLEFCSKKELIAQTGHEPDDWPLTIVEELIDNSLDATEEAGIAPVIHVTVGRSMIRVRDNGPGIRLGRRPSPRSSTSRPGPRAERRTSRQTEGAKVTPQKPSWRCRLR
jgi:hypothetical protein